MQPAPANGAGQQLDRHIQAVALVAEAAAQGQDGAGRVRVQGVGIVGRLAFGVEQPAVGHLGTAIALHPHLALGHSRRGHVEDDRRAAARRKRHGDWIGAVPSFAPAPRSHAADRRTVDEQQGDSGFRGNALHVAAEAADVIGLADGDSGHAHSARLFQSEVHAATHRHLPKAPMRVEYRERRGLVNDFDRGVWHNIAGFDLAQVLGDADDAVRVVADEIGLDEQFSDHVCLPGAHSSRGKNGGASFD